ncbi:MAG: hypothetical protein ABI142_11060 [Bryocella sp.]
MSHRSFRSIGQFILAASVGIASLGAQTPAAGTTAPSGPNPSRVDVFMGYSYFGAHGVVKPSNLPFSSVDEGAALSGAYYFNKYVGGEILGFANPDGQNDGLYAGYAGPIFRAPMQNFTLFAHFLAGGVRIAGPNSSVPATFEHEPYTWGAGLVAGGGMDYDLPFFNHRFGLRVFEADYRYIHVNYGPPTTIPTSGTLGGRGNLGAAELSTGILMHFGHILPPPPVTYACAVTAPTGTIYPGDVVTVTGTGGMLNAKRPVTYTWTSDSGPVAGSSNVASVDTKTLSAGTYTVKGHLSQGTKPGQFADCSSQFTVTAYQPPTVGCSANPSSVAPGDPSTITASGVSPQNRPLTYSYSASAGSISGNTSTATLSTAGVAPGTITVTCNAVDDKGQTASQQTTVSVSAPEAAAPATTKSLCTISFDRDQRRPTRVDNEAKACLDDIALNAQREPQAKLAVIGSSTAGKGRHASEWAAKRASERAVNTKEYLVKDKGVDASRITVYTGTADTNSAATTIIPSGATLDMNGLTPVDEASVKAVSRTAAPAHHHRRHKK